MDNVIYYASNLEDWIDVAKLMKDNHGWNPTYWIGSSEFRKRVEEEFDNIIYHKKKIGFSFSTSRRIF